MDLGKVLQALPTMRGREERNHALGAFVDRLDPYDVRHLQSLLLCKTFQMDVVGSLPLELVAQIFAYIDPVAVYRLQIVSRRWNFILRAPVVLKASLGPWCKNLHISNDLNSEAACVIYQEKAEKLHRFRTGRPYDERLYEMPKESCYSDRSSSTIQLVGDALIWIDPSRRILWTWNLCSGKRKPLFDVPRQTISKFSASTEAIAFATFNNTCYVTIGDETRSFKLPNSAIFKSMHCDGRMVACAGMIGFSAHLYIWDYDTRTGKSFTLGATEPPLAQCSPSPGNVHEIAVLLDSDVRLVTLFSVAHPPSFGTPYRSAAIHYAAYTFTGDQISQGSRSFDDITALELSQFLPVDNENRFALEAETDGRGGMDVNRFEFDRKTAKFTRKEEQLPKHLNRATSWWNDTFFQAVRPKGRKSEAIVCLRDRSNWHYRKLMEPESFENFEADLFQTYHASVLLSDKFAVHLARSELRIFSFDKHFIFPELEDVAGKPLKS